MPAGEATAAWHQPLVQIIAGTLTGDTTQTSGMTRLEAISGKSVGAEKLWMGETHVAPSTNSGDHHHGEAETAIYVVSGRPRFVFLEDGKEKVLQTSPGDYVVRAAVHAAPRGEPVAGHAGGRRHRPQHAGGDRRQPAEPRRLSGLTPRRATARGRAAPRRR